MTNKERKNALESEKLNMYSKLKETDYKNTKNDEARNAGLPFEYDPVELHNIRQPFRDRINEIEAEIAAIPDDKEDITGNIIEEIEENG